MTSNLYILCKVGKVLKILSSKILIAIVIWRKKIDYSQPIIIMLMLYVDVEIITVLMIKINKL